MLGDGVRGGHDRVLLLGALLRGRVLRAECARVVERAVERVVVARRLERLEMLGQRAVDHAVALQAGVLLPQHEEGLVVRRDWLAVLGGNEVGLVD